MPAMQRLTAAACVGMTLGFVWWNWQAFGSLRMLLLVVPLVVPTLFVFRRSVRPLVITGAIALPYLCVAVVEIVATSASRAAPIVAVSCAVVFMALLGPVTRNARGVAVSKYLASRDERATKSS